MTLYFDENFPKQIVAALCLFDYDAKHVLDEFDPGTDDTEMFPAIAASEGLWISHDKGVKRKPHEQRALVEAGLGAFIFTGRTSRTPREMLIFVFRHVDEILKTASHRTPPYVYGLSDRGKLERLR